MFRPDGACRCFGLTGYKYFAAAELGFVVFHEDLSLFMHHLVGVFEIDGLSGIAFGDPMAAAPEERYFCRNDQFPGWVSSVGATPVLFISQGSHPHIFPWISIALLYKWNTPLPTHKLLPPIADHS